MSYWTRDTTPAELVRLKLEQKDVEIQKLKIKNAELDKIKDALMIEGAEKIEELIGEKKQLMKENSELTKEITRLKNGLLEIRKIIENAPPKNVPSMVYEKSDELLYSDGS